MTELHHTDSMLMVEIGQRRRDWRAEPWLFA